jgi:hypothetical protein
VLMYHITTLATCSTFRAAKLRCFSRRGGRREALTLRMAWNRQRRQSRKRDLFLKSRRTGHFAAISGALEIKSERSFAIPGRRPFARIAKRATPIFTLHAIPFSASPVNTIPKRSASNIGWLRPR